MSPAPDAFDERSVDADPFLQFASWYSDAELATDGRAAAMVIATATPDGRPSSRVVLLRGFDERGFVFYTNYESRKAGDLAANPHAAGLFYWSELDRQVRVEGTTTKVGADESDEYFAMRPRGHQVGAWASPQSSPIADRAALQVRFDEAETRLRRRPHSGAAPGLLGRLPAGARDVRVLGEPDRPVARPGSLHRRGDVWVIERLAP